MKIKDIELREKYIKSFVKFNHILTKNQKQIFHLYFIEDLSISEVAQIVATTRSSVFDTLTKTKKKLDPFLDLI